MSFSKTRLESSPHDPLAAYAAGLIDGEGCVRLQRQTTKRTFTVVVQVSMSDKAKALLTSMRETFGGHLYAQDFKRPEWATQTTWRINGASAAVFLRRIRPFLILKREQAEIALALDDLRRAEGWTETTRATAAEMKARIQALNKKGPVPSAGDWYLPDADLFGITPRFLSRWPRLGTMLGGWCWELTTSAPRTVANAGGAVHGETRRVGSRIAVLPTPTAHEFAASEESLLGRLEKHGRVTVSLASWVKFPTPRASDGEKGGPNQMQGGQPTLAAAPGGSLNPTWVAWLMGWPLAHARLRHWATAKSRSVPPQPGACSADP
nr:hypothetical protein [Methylibium sp.]